MDTHKEDHIELFKLLNIDTNEKRQRYTQYGQGIEESKNVQEVTYIRTTNDTLVLGGAGDAKLESDQ